MVKAMAYYGSIMGRGSCLSHASLGSTGWIFLTKIWKFKRPNHRTSSILTWHSESSVWHHVLIFKWRGSMTGSFWISDFWIRFHLMINSVHLFQNMKHSEMCNASSPKHFGSPTLKQCTAHSHLWSVSWLSCSGF